MNQLGAARATEPALFVSEARMAKRRRDSQRRKLRVSEGQDARSERPATWHGRPRAGHGAGVVCKRSQDGEAQAG